MINQVPRITVRIDSEPRVGLPWKSGFRYTAFHGTLFIEGERIGETSCWRTSPKEAVAEAIGALYRGLLESARQVDVISPFYEVGLRPIISSSASESGYVIIEGTHGD
jgi:hypothetical protein